MGDFLEWKALFIDQRKGRRLGYPRIGITHPQRFGITNAKFLDDRSGTEAGGGLKSEHGVVALFISNPPSVSIRLYNPTAFHTRWGERERDNLYIHREPQGQPDSHRRSCSRTQQIVL